MRADTESKLKKSKSPPARPPESADVPGGVPAVASPADRPTFRTVNDVPEIVAARERYDLGCKERDAAHEKYQALQAQLAANGETDLRLKALAELDGSPPPTITQADVDAAAENWKVKAQIAQVLDERQREAFNAAAAVESTKFKTYIASRFGEMWNHILAASAILAEEKELRDELGELCDSSVRVLSRSQRNFPLEEVNIFMRDRIEGQLRLNFGVDIPVRETEQSMVAPPTAATVRNETSAQKAVPMRSHSGPGELEIVGERFGPHILPGPCDDDHAQPERPITTERPVGVRDVAAMAGRRSPDDLSRAAAAVQKGIRHGLGNAAGNPIDESEGVRLH